MPRKYTLHAGKKYAGQKCPHCGGTICEHSPIHTTKDGVVYHIGCWPAGEHRRNAELENAGVRNGR
jgi:hypothetical protein